MKLSHNGKTKFHSSQKNTFGLNYGRPEDGGTCPGATSGGGGCLDVRDGLKRETCYMAKIVQIYKAVGKVLQENTDELVGKTQEEMEVVCTTMIQTFIRANAGKALYFRLHYSGDFFSIDYAKAWANVIKAFPQVQFWVYTRSTDVVEHIVGIKNLTVMLSCDPVNYTNMVKIHGLYKDKHNNIALAWLGGKPPADHRWVVCPETSGKLKNTDERGACAKCRLCIDNYKIGVKNIAFNYH